MGINIAARERYIVQQSRKLNLDPAAVLAIIHHEGGSGRVGDGGHAFGPFQENDAGGVLTNAPAYQHSQAYTWSNAGIMQALRQIATVAGGLRGKSAVTAIATRYERPADPGAEIRDAMSVYGHSGLGSGTVQGNPNGQLIGTHADGSSTMFNAKQARQQTGMLMLTAAADRAQGNPMDPQDYANQLAAIKSASITRVASNGIPVAGQAKGPGAAVVAVAKRQIGTPYVWGGESKAGFDCSGLVQFAYKKLGINLPRTAAEQGKAGRAVSYNHLRPGDLLVEGNGDHVVMYAGNGRVIAAPHTGTTVQYQPLSYFPPSQYNARRIIGS
jgi:cell wall-associated NlpC family hydrolase